MNMRFIELRERIFSEIAKALGREGASKSYEGYLEAGVSYPSFFNDQKDELPKYFIRFDCYVIGPYRHHEYFGYNLDECIDQLEEDFDSWIVGLEEE